MTRKTATLVLDDGSMFHGFSFGFDKAVAGEVVFNTAMTGYPESLTDPSYAGQLMVLTYPLVGNYGVPPFSIEENGLPTFMESEKIHAEAIIVRVTIVKSIATGMLWKDLGDWLKRGEDSRNYRHRYPCADKKIREHGVMMGRIVIGTADKEGESGGNTGLR
ncbi:MAG: carbamoyl-phosphate synthase domain-containing protein [Parabacteroides merdae]